MPLFTTDPQGGIWAAASASLDPVSLITDQAQCGHPTRAGPFNFFLRTLELGLRASQTVSLEIQGGHTLPKGLEQSRKCPVG